MDNGGKTESLYFRKECNLSRRRFTEDSVELVTFIFAVWIVGNDSQITTPLFYQSEKRYSLTIVNSSNIYIQTWT